MKHARILLRPVAAAIAVALGLHGGMASAQAVDRPAGGGAAPSASTGMSPAQARLTLSPSCDPAADARLVAAQAAGEQGTTRLRFHISAQGALQHAEVVRSSGWQRLDRLALTALSRCRMEPARDEQGQAAAGSTVVEYVWLVH